MNLGSHEGITPATKNVSVNTKYSKLSAPSFNRCDLPPNNTHTKISVCPDKECINLNIQSETSVTVSSWNRLVTYLHVIILYVSIIYLFLELRETKRSVIAFESTLLETDLKTLERETSCIKEMVSLKEIVSKIDSQLSWSVEKDLKFSLDEEEHSLDYKNNNSDFLPLQMKLNKSLDILDGDEYSSGPSQTSFLSRSLRSLPQKNNHRGNKNGKRHRRNRKKVPMSLYLRGAQPDILVNDEGLIAPWFIEKQPSLVFDLSNKSQLSEGRGKVKVLEPGLYFIYAQVYYMTSNGLNSFTINLVGDGTKEEKLLSTCSVWGSGSAGGSPVAGETSCFTGVVKPLSKGDQLFLRQRERNRRVLLREGQTFLGLVLLSRQHPKKINEKRREGQQT